MFLLLLFLIIIVIIILWLDTGKPKDFPPGPPWLPVIGAIPLIKKLHDHFNFYHLVWYYLYRKYGNVVGLRVANQKLAIISGSEAIREFYATEEFNGRPDGFFYQIRTFGKRLGIVFCDGDYWNSQRKFAMKVLRKMGMGRSIMVKQLEEESISMIDHFQKLSRYGAVEMRFAFDIPVLNALWALVAGYRFDFDDERVKNLAHTIHESFRVIDMTGGILNLYPWIRHIAPNLSGYKPLMKTHFPLWNFLKEVVSEKLTIINSNEKGESFIESYLLEMRQNDEKNTSKIDFSHEQLLSLCVDFVQAGTETTSNTLSFGLMYMLHNKRVSDLVHAELDNIIGRTRLPRLSDRTQLPYIEAVLCEIQRYASVAPLAIAHRTTETVKFMSYVIPKDTVTLVSLYSLNMDALYWKDPQEFRPERFLNERGDLIPHGDHFIPFGLGKRRCIGENIARSSLFIYFASFMQAFKMAVPTGVNLPDINPMDGITLQPKPFKVELIRRI